MKDSLLAILVTTSIFLLIGCYHDEASFTFPDNSVTIAPTSQSTQESFVLEVDEDYTIFRQPKDITVYAFSDADITAALNIANNVVEALKRESGVEYFEVHTLAFDPILTDIHIRQEIAQSPVPGWYENDYYEHYISFCLVYSATYDHSITFVPDATHSTIGIHLYRANSIDPWRVDTTGVPTTEYSDSILGKEDLAGFESEDVHILAGYHPNANEYWLYLQNTETGVVSYEITIESGINETELLQTEPSEQPTEPAPTQPAETEPGFSVVLPESIPQSGSPITPQPGDTSSSWNFSKAANYPKDDDCSDLELLEKWMAVEGLSYADLEQRDCHQLILVVAKEADGVQTYTTCYQRQSDGSWACVEGLAWMNGHTGSNGIAHNRKRNTNTSPAGLWSLGTAFGNAERPDGIKMPWRDITPNSDWVCDANSIYFNTWQERNDPTLTESWDYGDVEHLEDYLTQYAYACVIEYNTPPYTIPDRGCAIFLHCSKSATGGCIGLNETDMLDVLLWLDQAENPHILITGHA